MKKKLFAALSAFGLVFGLLTAPASADPGPNYTIASTTDWVLASNTVTRWSWTPGADYWKVEVRVKCPSVYPAQSDVTIALSIIKGSGPSWRAYEDTVDSYYDGPGTVDLDYPGGEGVAGFHTPDYDGPFIFAVYPEYFHENNGGTRCSYRLAFYNKIRTFPKHG